MISRRIETALKALTIVLFASLAVLLLISGYQKQQWDTDIFWALKSGEWILSNLSVPDSDPFSYTFGGMPWIDFTWGFQVLAHLFYSYLGDWFGLFILRSILVSLTFGFLYLTLRLIIVERAFIIAILFMAFAAAQPRLFIRPHLFEYFFISLFFLLLTLYEKKEKTVFLFLIVPAQVLWINCHSSSILGIWIVGCFAAGEAIENLINGGPSSLFNRKTVSLSAVAAALPLASLINPYGYKLLMLPFAHQAVDNADALRHIEEWARPDLRELFFSFYPYPTDRFSIFLFCAGIAACWALAPRLIRVRSIFIVAGALYLASNHVRWAPLFAFIAAPVLAEGISAIRNKVEGRVVVKFAALILALFLVSTHLYEYLGETSTKNMGLGIAEGRFPDKTVAFMKREGIKGRVYNDYVFGGYIINELPEVKVFIDGRTPTLYSPYFFWTSRMAERMDRWKRLEEEHGINIALIKPESALCSVLGESPEWSAVAIDDVSALFLKRSDFGEIAGRGFKEFKPCLDGIAYRPPVNREETEIALSELEAALKSSGPSARVFRLAALNHMTLGQHDRAAERLREALNIKADAYTWHDLGSALRKAKKYKEAVECYEKAIALKPDYKEAHLGLAMALTDAGENPAAISFFKKYMELAGDGADREAYSALGMALFNKRDFEGAALYLKRAAFLADTSGDLGKNTFYLGSSYFELKDFDEGLKWYSKALTARAEYKVVLKELATSHELNGRTEEARLIRSLPGVLH